MHAMVICYNFYITKPAFPSLCQYIYIPAIIPVFIFQLYFRILFQFILDEKVGDIFIYSLLILEKDKNCMK